MKRTIKTKGREGQAMVEFALVIPVLLLLLLGIIEFGLLLYNQQVITNASREGARYGIVARETRRDLTEITAVVDAYAGSRMVTFGSGSPNTTMATPDGTDFGDDLTVTVTFHYDFLVLPNFLAFLVGGQTLEARTTMKYE
jgi:Flp pilus assembly protein TadG